MFGLINANARLYSPYLGRFVSPDPLLNSEGGPLLYNPYIYANNNPFKYIDRGGEEPITLIALLIGFAVGGTINVACNWENIHDVGDFCAFFGVGGTAGIAGVAAAALAPAGAIAGALYGAVGGALSGALLGGGNALLLGQDPWKAALTGMWQGAATGVILGGLTGGAKAIDGNKSWLTGSPKVKANPAANISATPQNSGAKSTLMKDVKSPSSTSSSETLIHYTSKEGYQQILETEKLNPSVGIKNARYGEGQYFTNLEPKDYTAGQISRKLYGVPWNTSKLQYYIKIDMKGLNPIQNNPHNFLVPGNNSLPLHGRILDSGVSVFKINF
jgi:RHS repeat-associated protein